MIPSFLERRLEIAAEIWSEVSVTSHPADRWLGTYFYQRSRRFGSQDRRFYSELIYALFRHKNFLTAWSEKLFPGKEIWGVLVLAVAMESLASKEEILECAEKLGGSLTENETKQIRKLELPVSKKGMSETALFCLKYSFPDASFTV